MNAITVTLTWQPVPYTAGWTVSALPFWQTRASSLLWNINTERLEKGLYPFPVRVWKSLLRLLLSCCCTSVSQSKPKTPFTHSLRHILNVRLAGGHVVKVPAGIGSKRVPWIKTSLKPDGWHVYTRQRSLLRNRLNAFQPGGKFLHVRPGIRQSLMPWESYKHHEWSSWQTARIETCSVSAK